jgi:sec-independent protein translocase protein TatC
MKGFRRQIVVIILLVSGIITPSPDMVSQLLVAVPLYFLYEASIMVSRRVVNKMAAEEAAAEALEK